ncbi:EAL domain-containing protein [Acidothermaceae bacterium B102]|nr:EAL domain-containing protein [Acidothermaceae bacterium B102]
MPQEQGSPQPTATDEIGTPSDLVDRYRLLAELSPDGLIVHQDGVIVYANPAGLRLAGAAQDSDLLGKSIIGFVHSDDIGPMMARLAALDRDGAVSGPVDARMLTVDGREFAAAVTSVRTTWRGRPAMQVILRDLHDSMTAKAALQYQAALVAHVSDGIIALDRVGQVTTWNPAAEAIYGWAAHEVVGRPVLQFLGSLPPVGQSGQVHHQRRDGTPVTARVSVSELRDLGGGPTGAVIVCSDETAKLKAEQRYAAVVASLQEGICVIGADGRVESVNPAAERLLGASREQIVGATLDHVQIWDEAGRPLPMAERPSTESSQYGRTVHGRIVGRRGPEGLPLWLSVSSRPLIDNGESPFPVVLSFTDVTERKNASAALLHAATHDPLTSLANRSVTLNAIDDGLSALRGDGDALAVVFLDLDHFKVVNDSLGHGMGDQILRVVANRLRRVAGPGDVVGRLGGDEFVVVSHSACDVDGANELASRLRSALTEPIEVMDRHIVVGASAGVVLVTDAAGWSAEDLLRDADVAMYQAKDHGRDRHELFDAELRARAVRRLQLEEDLRAALDTDQLWIAHQPVIDLHTGRVISTEALLRWNHPELGFISPAEFIPIAEESGLILPLGLRVLEDACAQTALWRRTHDELAELTIAVNLSARQLTDPCLVGGVTAVLARTGLPAEALWLEITESMLMADTENAIHVMDELRRCGVHLSIDDFGTGYSSLAYLRRFPVEALKIDRSFISSMHDDQDDAVIVDTVLTLAHGLGLRVVAEGVELQEQLDKLRALGCDEVQGYLTGRPSRASDLLPTLLLPCS